MSAWSGGAWPLSPNSRFSRTVSQGNTEPCCEMRIPRGSGLECRVPSITTAPASGRMNPAIRLRSVVLPQPEGPTMATNSPSRTLKLTLSMTSRRPLSEANPLLTSRTSILVRIAPPDPPHTLQQAHQAVEREPNQADDDHAGDDQIVAVPGIAGVHDHVPESRVQGDHLRGHDDEPCNTESDAHADDHLRQHCRDHDAREQRAARDPEILGSAQIALLDGVHADGGLHDHGKHRRDEDQIDGRGITDSKPENRDRNPRDRGDGPKDLEEGIQHPVGAAYPTRPQPEWNGNTRGKPEADDDPQERCADVLPERAVLDQLPGSADDRPRRRENEAPRDDYRCPPKGDERDDDCQRRERCLEAIHDHGSVRIRDGNGTRYAPFAGARARTVRAPARRVSPRASPDREGR